MSYTYEYPRTALTADAIVFKIPFRGISIGEIALEGSVLLIKRANEPFKHHWCLPGGYHNPLERYAGTASRELREETGLDIDEDQFVLVGVYDSLTRDPRGHTPTIAYYTMVTGDHEIKGSDDAAHAEWVPLTKARNLTLGFDHGEILREAYNKLCDSLGMTR